MSPKPLVLALSLAVSTVTPAVAQDHSHGHAQTAGSISAEATDAAATVDAFHAALKAGDTSAALSLLAPDVNL